MPPELLRQFIQRRPFRPFRLYVLETTVYEIRHPELVAIGKSSVTIHSQLPDELLLLPERVVLIALLHVTKLEPIVKPVAASGNGQAGQGAPA